MIEKLTIRKIAGTNIDVHFYDKRGNSVFRRQHTHDFWEILIVVEGSILWKKQDGETLTFSTNEICMCKPETVHTILECVDAPLRFISFEINKDFFERLIKTIDINFLETANEVLFISTTCDSFEMLQYMKLIDKIESVPFEDLQTRQRWLRILINQLFLRFLQIESKINKRYLHKIVSRVVSEFEKTDNMQLGFREICKNMNYSPEYIIRVFKREKIDSPNKIFMKCKFRRACALLETTDMKVVDIAMDVGVYSIGYFNKKFKALYGVTPIEYRKRHIMNTGDRN